MSPSLAIIPEGATLDAFHQVLFDSSFPNWIFNSLVVTLGTAAVGVLLVGHVRLRLLAPQVPGSRLRPDVPVRDPAHPGHHAARPDLHPHRVQLGLVGSYQGLVIAYAVTAVPFSIWILKGYYDTVPIDLEEAARIDGCSEFQAFYKVLLPLSLPALAIVFLFNFLAAWGEYFFATSIIGTNEALLTWPVGHPALPGAVPDAVGGPLGRRRSSSACRSSSSSSTSPSTSSPASRWEA